MANIIKNKRGDIPITILVIGVFIICLLAIFSFYFSDRAVKNSFDSIGLIEEASIIKDKIAVYLNLGFNSQEIDKIFDIKSDVLGRYFILKKEGISVRYNLGQ